MKIIGLTILFIGLLTGFSLGMDLLSGFDLNTSVKNAFNPFLVMEVEELSLFFLLVIYFVSIPVRSFLQKKKKGTPKDKKQQES